MNKLVKVVSRDKLYEEYLKALNGILNLTDRELELMVKLIEFDIGFTPAPGVAKNVASTANRKIIRSTLRITSDNLSRYISKFKRDGLLVKGKAEDELYVNRILIPDLIKDRVQITIILKTEDATTENSSNIHTVG